MSSLLEPVFVLGVTTAWLYAVSITYMSGYLRLFGADTSWFNPSLFRLMAFSYTAITISAVPAVAYLFLWLTVSAASRVWWVIYGLWVLFFGAVGGYYAYACHLEFAPLGRADGIGAVLSCIVWVVAPLALLAPYQAGKRAAVWQSEPSRSQLAPTLEGFLVRYRVLFPLVTCACVYLVVANWQGFIAAHLASSRLASLSESKSSLLRITADSTVIKQMDAAIPSEYMLYTDGEARLVASTDGDGGPAFTFYSNGVAIKLVSLAQVRRIERVLHENLDALNSARESLEKVSQQLGELQRQK